MSKFVTQWPERATLAAGAVALAACVLAAHPAAAQMVSGGADPTVTMPALYTWASRIAGGSIAMISLWKGSHAAGRHEHMGPAIAGLLGGSVIAFSGVAIITRVVPAIAGALAGIGG